MSYLIEDNIQLFQTTTPGSNPPVGYQYIYIKSDGKLYTLNSSGIESQVGGNASSIKQVEIDLGNGPYKTQGKFNIIDSDILSTSNIMVSKVVKSPSDGRQEEEMIVENYQIATKANTGSFDLYIISTLGTISGKFLINYTY
jgi:hypothetical protein